ncbi:MAG TPA: hypothetical protein VIH16_02640 [Bellilinea sp.]
MKPGFPLGKSGGGLGHIQRYMGMVSLLLFITACLGIQIIAFLASNRGNEVLTGVRVLSKSTADYSFDEILRLAPILPGILEDIERDLPFLTPEVTTPPAIGLVIPGITNTITGTTPGIITTITPPDETTLPTGISTDNPTPGTTETTTSPPTIVPTTSTPPSTATPKTPTPITPVVTTPVPTTRVPTTQAPTTLVPTTRVPTTAVPTTLVPTPIPATPTPTDIIVFPTPTDAPSEEPTWVEETLPGNGLDILSTPVASLQLVPSLWSVLHTRIGISAGVCSLPAFSLVQPGGNELFLNLIAGKD